MARSGKDKSKEAVEGQVIPAHPAPKPPRLRLGTLRECKRELIKLYSEARMGALQSQEATRLAFLIQTIMNAIKDHELEQRITALEKQQDETTGRKDY